MSDTTQRIALIAEQYHNEHCDVFHPGDLAETIVSKLGIQRKRDEFLAFAKWLLKDEIGEDREEEIVDKYLAEHEARDDVHLLEDAADAIADWINGAPCTDEAYARSLVNRLSTLRLT
jgi:hypothetical protein